MKERERPWLGVVTWLQNNINLLLDWFLCIFSAFEVRSGTQFKAALYTDLSTFCRDKSHTYLPLPQIVFFVISQILGDTWPVPTRVFRRVGERTWERIWYSSWWNLTIVPWARMGYWLRGHEGERSNCFSKIQLVGQKYRDKTTLASKRRFNRHCWFSKPALFAISGL